MITRLSLATSTLLAVVLITKTVSASGTALTQAQAEARLIPNGITASSSGGCTDRNIPSCTSYQGILSGTVDGAITLKKASGVSSMVITGGTEVGHASGTYSHAKGYKVDIRHSTVLDNYIHTAFTKIANRGDGFPQWKAASGNLYCDEGSHWDVTFF
ncbi:hypothetical protein BGX29_007140 [Mortierella sp. GBA35]|nr:hypothetical protein BGX23_008186 [Mortierella sp. AD031]KAF9099441.1 hypothetical protein BGX29_007140 [Mortierella sp. GBA35]KAG0209627.1 hypothetical protein BGX33_005402 [Mortierella sp. NVP41]